MQLLRMRKKNPPRTLAFLPCRCYNIRVDFCLDGGRLHAHDVDMFRREDMRPSIVLNVAAFHYAPVSTAGRLHSPGDGTEGADERAPLEWVAPDKANPFRCFIMTAKAVMNHLRGAKPQGSPHRHEPVRPKIWRCIEQMARISGVDLPREKRVEYGLTYIYGIGLKTSQKMLAEVGINPDTRVKDLSENDISKLRDYIEHNLKVEGDLRREVALNIKRLMEIGCYRGVRHRRGLPVRGQNTKNNARTRKGPAKTIAGKKKAGK